MILRDCNWNSYPVIEVTFDYGDISAARAVAAQKLAFINVHNPGGIVRPPAVIESRIIAGKLADAAVLEMLKARSSQYLSGPQPVFSEYDNIRQDRFEHPDPFDLQCVHPQTLVSETIEVRSSFAYRLPSEHKIADKLSVYGWYTSGSKQIEEPRDWYWQFFYYLRPQDCIPSNDFNVKVFETELNTGSVMGYIVGGASRQLLDARGIDRQDQDSANYRAISPIVEAMDVWQMLYAMVGILPPCPACGAMMTIKTARRGPNTGQEFWGCSTYPGCNGIRPR